MKIKSIDYSIVDHCNLNCAGCSHFSPLAKSKYASLEIFEKNISKLSTYNLVIEQFNLLGGEPLLHPQIKDFIIISKKYLNTNIVIKTNGILLTDDFIQFCNNQNIILVVANYGLNEKNSNDIWCSTINSTCITSCYL
jgi:ABC-2 type transport system ATP-binding protein